MKKLMFILILLLAGNVVSLAQNTELDSLINAEKNYTKEDTVHLSLLRKIYRLCMDVNIEQSLEFCNKAKNIAERLGNRYFLADAIDIMGCAHLALGKTNLAFEELNQSLSIFEEIGDSLHIAITFRHLGIYYILNSDRRAAEKYLIQALDIFKALGRNRELAIAYHNLFGIYYGICDYVRARDCAYKELFIAEQLQDDELIALSYEHLGKTYGAMGDHLKERDYYCKTLIIYESYGKTHWIATLKKQIANTYFTNHEYGEKPLKYLSEAIYIFLSQNDIRNLSDALAVAAYALNTMTDSIFINFRQYDIFERLGLEVNNKYELAIACANKAITCYNDMSNLSNISECYGQKGVAYSKLGKFDLAIENLDKQYMLADSSGDVYSMKGAMGEKVNIYETLGKNDSAYSCYKKYISIRDTIDNKSIRDQLARKEAEYEYSIKEKDILHQKELSDVAAANANTELQHQLLLARTREQEMLLKDKALEIGRKDKEMQHLAYLKKMAELDVVKLDKQDKDKQLSLTKQSYALQNLKLGKRELERNLLIVGVALSLLSIFLIFRNYRNQRKSNLKQKELNSNIRWANEELNHKNTKLAETLDDLKQTQAQLVETEKQKETEVIRRRISQDIHDDISSGLTRIAWLSELAREKAKNGSPADAESALEKILASSRETVDRLGEIIWAINPDRDNLEGFFAYLRSYIVRFFEDTKFDITLDFPEQKPDLKFNPDLKRTLFLVVKEALHNIAKHSEAKKIGVAFHCPDHRYSITITDDGKGFDPVAMEQKSNGLNNMRKRMESVGGNIEIESQPEQGTVVSLEGEVYS
jgi:signal transduction histidine kinase